jgi:hypothetical protein
MVSRKSGGRCRMRVAGFMRSGLCPVGGQSSNRRASVLSTAPDIRILRELPREHCAGMHQFSDRSVGRAVYRHPSVLTAPEIDPKPQGKCLFEIHASSSNQSSLLPQAIPWSGVSCHRAPYPLVPTCEALVPAIEALVPDCAAWNSQAMLGRHSAGRILLRLKIRQDALHRQLFLGGLKTNENQKRETAKPLQERRSYC